MDRQLTISGHEVGATYSRDGSVVRDAVVFLECRAKDGPAAVALRKEARRAVAEALGLPLKKVRAQAVATEDQTRYYGETAAAEDIDPDAEPQDGDTIMCEFCGKWEVSYDSSREEQLCEDCAKLAEREKLRELVAAEATSFSQQVEALGLFAEQDNSGLSEAVYFEIGDPAKEDDEDAEIVKVRMAAHEARPTYLKLNGSPDFEIGNIGGKQYTQDSDGDAAACLAWLKRKFEK